jgi:hypothetical protein
MPKTKMPKTMPKTKTRRRRDEDEKGQDSSVLLQAALPLGRRLRRRLGGRSGPPAP